VGLCDFVQLGQRRRCHPHKSGKQTAGHDKEIWGRAQIRWCEWAVEREAARCEIRAGFCISGGGYAAVEATECGVHELILCEFRW
jgi:hypothetical protein